jgi:hypothetical protein
VICDASGQPVTRALFSEAELAMMEVVATLTRSLIRARKVDALLAQEFEALAKAAIATGGTAESTMQRWLPIFSLLEITTDPAAWSAGSLR